MLVVGGSSDKVLEEDGVIAVGENGIEGADGIRMDNAIVGKYIVVSNGGSSGYGGSYGDGRLRGSYGDGRLRDY